LATLAAAAHTAAKKIDVAAQTVAPVYSPPIALCSAPPIGGPVKAAKDNIEKAIPKRVPIIRRSGVTLAIVEGNKHWKAALVKPQKAVKAYRPPTLRTASQQNVTRLIINRVGTIMLSWPSLSAKKGGMIRAGMPIALMRITRLVLDV